MTNTDPADAVAKLPDGDATVVEPEYRRRKPTPESPKLDDTETF